MNGFIARVEAAAGCRKPGDRTCSEIPRPPDAIGYHDSRQIPNYWRYAHEFVLQDHMFEPVMSWTLTSRMYIDLGLVGALLDTGRSGELRKRARQHGAAARLSLQGLVLLRADASLRLDRPDLPPAQGGVSWAYYIHKRPEPRCPDHTSVLKFNSHPFTPGEWKPLSFFDDVREDGQFGNIKSIEGFYKAAQAGTLPAVTWIAPSPEVSEHTPFLISKGQAYVTGLVNAIMRGPDWASTAIFISWDDLAASTTTWCRRRSMRTATACACRDSSSAPTPSAATSTTRRSPSTPTSSSSKTTSWAGSGSTGHRRAPDPRPTVRENVAVLGDLSNDFNFTQRPRKPVLLTLHPRPVPASAFSGR